MDARVEEEVVHTPLEVHDRVPDQGLGVSGHVREVTEAETRAEAEDGIATWLSQTVRTMFHKR